MDTLENIAVFIMANTFNLKTGQLIPLSEEVLDTLVESKNNIQFNNLDEIQRFLLLTKEIPSLRQHFSLKEYSGYKMIKQ